MYKKRQNIIKRQSQSSLSKTSQNILNEYGIGVLKQSENKKLHKSKSHKDVLIAKNKKLNHFFPLNQNKSENYFQKMSQSMGVKNHPKLILSNNKKAQIQKSLKEQEKIQTFRTSYFGEVSEIKDNMTIQQKVKHMALHTTFDSDREQAKKLKQRLKKSTSMKNLIQQHFLSQNQQKNIKNQNPKANIYTAQKDSDYTSQTYDSAKYNWKLSRSKEKSRQKSLSAIESKAKILFGLHKIEVNKKKLYLQQNRNAQQVKIKEKSKNLNDDKDKMTYTFGSDIYQSNHLY